MSVAPKQSSRTPRVRTPYATHDDSGAAPTSARRGASSGRRKQSKPADTALRAGHSPPKYNIYGQQLRPGKGSGLAIKSAKGYNTMSGKPELPSYWKHTPKRTRRAEIREARRQDFIAHPSYDLDGDGVVNQRDYFFAKQFDKDKDGKLNAQEWAAAHKALKEGYAKKFHVVSGPPAEFLEHRVMQKRGQVIIEEKEGWHPLEKTYGAKDTQPASFKAPFPRESEGGAADGPERYQKATSGATTRVQLLQTRRKKNLEELRSFAGEPQAPDDLPSPLRERPKVSTSASRSKLLRKRRADATLEVLRKQGLPLGDITQIPFQSFIETRRMQSTMRHTASRNELLQERQREFKREAALLAPTKPHGVHTFVLPSYAEKARAAGGGADQPMWWKDTTHLDGREPLPWEEPQTELLARSASRREVKGPKSGKLLSCTGKLQDGGVMNDPFKTRTITPDEIAARMRRRRELSRKPIEVRPKLPPRAGTGTAPAMAKKRWTDFVIEFNGEEDERLIDEHGKLIFSDPRDFDPLYSSFTPTHRFPDGARSGSRAGTSRSSRRMRRTFGTSVALAAEEEAARTRPATTRFSRNRGAGSRSAHFAPQTQFGGYPDGGRPSRSREGMQHSASQPAPLVTSGPSQGRGRLTTPVSGTAVTNGGIQHPRYGARREETRPVRPQRMVAPPSPACSLIEPAAFDGPDAAVGVRAGGFQRLMDSGAMRRAVSTPMLLTGREPGMF